MAPIFSIHSLFSNKKKKNEGGRSGDENGGSSDDSAADDDQHRQGFFVGGSERSGQQVLGPRSDRDLDSATRLFNAARRAGAEQISPEEAEAAHAGPNSTFHGAAYRLGGHGHESQPIEPNRDEVAEADRGRPLSVSFNMWNNGFSIDDGPLREMADPANRPLLQAIARGQLPQELLQLHPHRKIDLHMHRRGVDYVPPKPKPFSGQGMRLGSVVPNVVGDADSSSSSANSALKPPSVEGSSLGTRAFRKAYCSTAPSSSPPCSESSRLLAEAQAQVNVQVEQPRTRIQIRIASSPPIVGNFNEGHRVSDLRSFIVTARPDLAFSPFQLATAYPPKAIEDEEATLKEANLLNCAINVKFL